MQKDMFGRIKKRKGYLYYKLAKYDRDTFDERLERLRYVNRIFPKGYTFLTELETAYLFDEAKMVFVNGNLIATLMVAEAYIEHRLQGFLESRGLTKESKKGLKSILKFLRSRGAMNNLLIDKADHLREFRNPFSHLRPMEDQGRLSNRIFQERRLPDEILETEAKNALALMYQLAITRLYLSKVA